MNRILEIIAAFLGGLKTDAASSDSLHEPHCPVPRAATRGEGAVCMCVGWYVFAGKLDELPRDRLVLWFTKPSQNMNSLSWAEVFDVKDDEEVDLVIDSMIEAGIGRPQDQLREVVCSTRYSRKA